MAAARTGHRMVAGWLGLDIIRRYGQPTIVVVHDQPDRSTLALASPGHSSRRHTASERDRGRTGVRPVRRRAPTGTAPPPGIIHHPPRR